MLKTNARCFLANTKLAENFPANTLKRVNKNNALLNTSRNCLNIFKSAHVQTRFLLGLEMAAFMQIRAAKNYRDRVITHHGDYHELFRFTEENVDWLSDYFLGQSDETRGGALTSKQKMEIFLRMLSDPGYQVRVAKDLEWN